MGDEMIPLELAQHATAQHLQILQTEIEKLAARVLALEEKQKFGTTYAQGAST